MKDSAAETKAEGKWDEAKGKGKQFIGEVKEDAEDVNRK